MKHYFTIKRRTQAPKMITGRLLRHRSHITTRLRNTLALVALIYQVALAAAICPSQCTCDAINVTCNNANLKLVPHTLNPSVIALLLRNNHIRSIDANTFTFYPHLRHLDMSDNQLTIVPNDAFRLQAQLQVTVRAFWRQKFRPWSTAAREGHLFSRPCYKCH